ncbi:MAG: hypothetical protein JJE04_10340 [Acidobacteriia bacterium]|nr:hypothetical protein [Terriglobia bacterium]
MNAACSVQGVTIRLTAERLVHITEEHSELAGYLFEILGVIEEPGAIYEGNLGEHLACRETEPGKHLG